jgi:AraC family transcriptional regulator
MHLTRKRLGNGARLDLSLGDPGAEGGDGALSWVLGGGRGCTLHVGGSAMAIWAPLRGRLQVCNGDGGFTLTAGNILVSECEARLHATGRGCALWIAVMGTRAAWRRALAGLIDAPTGDFLLLPARHITERGFRRVALSLARAVANSDAAAQRATVALFDAVLELQAAFEPLIARCPGRSYSQRRNVFPRLQRVHNYMEANCQLDLEIESLARMTNYSPCHFIRAFCAAYGVTPHAYLVNQRLQRARRLLCSSPLGIAEIALASGFENRCAFSRLFHRRFGSTASALRQQTAAVAPLARANEPI